MANQDSGYFGLKIGEALSQGAGHIAEGLQRKYALQEAKRKEDEQRQMAFSSKGIDYDPENPHLAFEAVSTMSKKTRGIEEQRSQAEIDLMNRRASAVSAKAPIGYRYNEYGSLEAIPGGPAFDKLQEKDIKKEQAQKTYDLKIKNVKDTIDSAMGQIGYTTAGLGGKILGGIGMTGPVDLEGALNTIKSNLGFDRLTQMRAESPTGGALGNVSDRELQLLTSTVQSLDQRQSPATLKKNLAIIRGYLDDSSAIKATTSKATEAPKSDPLGLYK